MHSILSEPTDTTCHILLGILDPAKSNVPGSDKREKEKKKKELINIQRHR